MKKRIFALALALCMMLSAMPTSFAGNGFLTLDNGEQEPSEPSGILTPGDPVLPEEDLSGEPHLTLDDPAEGSQPAPDDPIDEPHLTLDDPVDEPEDRPAHQWRPAPFEEETFTQCDICGYLDGSHAGDCPVVNPPEEQAPAQSTIAEYKPAPMSAATYQDIYDSMMSAETLAEYKAELSALSADLQEEFFSLLTGEEREALSEREDSLAHDALTVAGAENATRTVTVEARASAFSFALHEALRQLGQDLIVSIYGRILESIDLPQNDYTMLETITPTDGAQYQWQIQADDDLWVDIYNETGSIIRVSYAMVASLLDRYDAVQVRCEITGEDGVSYTDPVEVCVDYTSEDVYIDAEEDPIEPVILDEGKVEITQGQPVEPEAPAGPEEITEPEDTAEPATPAEPEDTAAPDNTAEPENTADPVAQSFSVTRLGSVYAQNFSVRQLTGEEEQATTYNVVVNYRFENNEIVADPYTASLAAGTNFSAKVTFPTIQGYLPYVDEVQQNSIELNYTAIDQDYTINVVYKPTNVDYTVIHYQQNLNNDNYTETERETKQGLTNSTVPDVAKTYEGFYALLYEKPAIAADGSTVVEVYYDRYYYLMNFDLDGGYGVEPIYARYGTPIDVGEPTKAGYEFKGWDEAVPKTMPAENRTYKAVWEADGLVNYTVVYWKENANDSNYSFWGQVTKQANAGTTVSGEDDIPTSITNATVDGETVNEKPYFTYNAAKTNKDVVVKGDGTTVVNVYYYRNTYHLYFRGISGTCAIEEHTHGDGNCNSYLDCLQSEHTHDETCARVLSCTLPVHEHTEDCLGLTCGQEEHTEHTADCLICGKVEHNHATQGCALECTHTHTLDCYSLTNGWLESTNKPSETLTSAGNGIWIYTTTDYIPIIGNVATTHYYLELDGKWYVPYRNRVLGGGTTADNKIEITFNCSHTTHNDACYDCNLINHSHSDSCYKDKLHTHDSSCEGLICGQAAHIHTDSCYTYTCGAEAHTHTSSCYRPCTKLVHTHTNQCSENSSNNVIYVISAKYEQDISSVWPTADKFSDYTLKGWSIDGVSAMAVSKRVSMTADLCDTSDHLKYAKANSGGTVQYLYYMFESFDQTSAASGDTRKYLNGTYYDSNTKYYQQVNSGATNWGQKPIEGMVATGTVKYESNDTKVFLYYTRNRSALMFNNSSDGIVKTVSSIMYEQPLVNYRDSNGNLLSEFVPSYPSKLEPNAYEFKGWYTTPECYDGTEFNFTTATMPNGDLTIYAKWAPKGLKVEFYLDKAALDAGTKLSTHPDITVPHGSLATPTPADPKNGSYTFVGWFYMENGVEKAFDFANMPVTKDMQVYGKWSSNVLKQYTVYYKIQGTDTEIAAPTTGSGLAGVTKTFEAKGGSDLYADYQEGYFPVTKSHSMTLDINATGENDTNVFTFWYVQKEAVPYTVKYLNKETGEPVATEKTVSDNRKAVVTETFVPVNGMMPDAYQKRLVVSVDENGNPDTEHNVIIFYYTKDTTHAYYKITHYTENLAKDALGNPTWTDYASSQAVGDIRTTYTAEPMTIPGFTYDSTVTGTVVSGELTASGLELKLYYTRNSYPYQVRYLEQGTGKQLADPKNGTDKYGQVISENPVDLLTQGYAPVDKNAQTLLIRIEESQTEAKLNIITFYYKLALTDLTITKKWDSKDDPCYKQDTIFIVKGEGLPEDGLRVVIPHNESSVTITGLTVGQTYTVTEDSGWSWRYTATSDPENGQITLVADKNANLIVFTNKLDRDNGKIYWLDDSDHKKNQFGVKNGN